MDLTGKAASRYFASAVLAIVGLGVLLIAWSPAFKLKPKETACDLCAPKTNDPIDANVTMEELQRRFGPYGRDAGFPVDAQPAPKDVASPAAGQSDSSGLNDRVDEARKRAKDSVEKNATGSSISVEKNATDGNKKTRSSVTALAPIFKAQKSVRDPELDRLRRGFWSARRALSRGELSADNLLKVRRYARALQLRNYNEESLRVVDYTDRLKIGKRLAAMGQAAAKDALAVYGLILNTKALALYSRYWVEVRKESRDDAKSTLSESARTLEERTKAFDAAEDIVRQLSARGGETYLTIRLAHVTAFNRRSSPNSDSSSKDWEVKTEAACAFADKAFAKFPDEEFALDDYAWCQGERAAYLRAQNRRDEARMVAQKAIDVVNVRFAAKKARAASREALATLYFEFAQSYKFGSEPYKDNVANAWHILSEGVRASLSEPGGQTFVPDWASGVRSIYFASFADAQPSGDDLCLLDQWSDQYPNIADLAYVAGDAWGKVGLAVARKAEDGMDPELSAEAERCAQQAGVLKSSVTATALAIIDHALSQIEPTTPVDEKLLPESLDESYQSVFSLYAARVRLLAHVGRPEDAIRAGDILLRKIGPYLKKFPYDYYVRVHQWAVYRQLGRELFDRGPTCDAQRFLNLGSYWGTAEITRRYAASYRRGVCVARDAVEADRLAQRAAIQGGMKRFTVPANFGADTYPMNLYVFDTPLDYPYRGVTDQQLWLKEARGGTLPQDVVVSFEKLHDIARSNSVSFPELTVYALGQAQVEPPVVESARKRAKAGDPKGALDDLAKAASALRAADVATTLPKILTAAHQIFQLGIKQRRIKKSDESVTTIFRELARIAADTYQVLQRQGNADAAFGAGLYELGRALNDVGLQVESIAALENSVAARLFATSSFNNISERDEVADTLSMVADALVHQDRRARALETRGTLVFVREALADEDPLFKRQIDLIGARLARVRLLQGDWSVREADTDDLRRSAADLDAARTLITTYDKDTSGSEKKNAVAARQATVGSLIDVADAYKQQGFAARDAGMFAFALDLQKRVIALRESAAADPKAVGAARAELSSELVSASGYALFARRYDEAQAFAKRALDLAPDNLVPAGNLAHALMLSGSSDDARALYLRYRGMKMSPTSGRRWDDVTREDFGLLRRMGQTSPLMTEIEAQLAPPAQSGDGR